MMRAMGRRESDSSPNNSLVNGWPARMPLSMRMVEPELPQSSGAVGAWRRLAEAGYFDGAIVGAAPCGRRVAAMHPSVLAQSRAAEKL